MFQQDFVLGSTSVGRDAPPVVIAEAGVSHFGDSGKMDALIDMAVEAGADIFKTQAYVTDSMIAATLPEWQKRMRIKEVDRAFLERAHSRCASRGITFLCTAHDETALEWLESMDVCGYKIGSGEKGNWPFIAKIAARRRPMIVSTGMYLQADIDALVETCRAQEQDQMALLHCVTAYPVPVEAAHLRVISHLRACYEGPVGYSDHTHGHAAAVAAVALGACIIEKHISLEFDLPDAQDWKVACGPEDFGTFVEAIRSTFTMLGRQEKSLNSFEQAALEWALKRLVARRSLRQGQCLTDRDVIAKRSPQGLAPDRMPEVIGKTLARDLSQDDPITWDALT